MAVTKNDSLSFERVPLPDNDAYRALGLNIGPIPTTLSSIPELPPKTVELLPVKKDVAILTFTDAKVPVDATNSSTDFTPQSGTEKVVIDTKIHPPNFVQPHPPYNVYSAKIFSARELTKPGAEKRTYHFDLDVTDYPEELGVDFKVGGAIGVMAPNEASVVEEIFDLLLIPKYIRDRPVHLKTSNGRWPTVWGDDQARDIHTTRRDLLTWCSDIQSYPPTKPLLRLLWH